MNRDVWNIVLVGGFFVILRKRAADIFVSTIRKGLRVTHVKSL